MKPRDIKAIRAKAKMTRARFAIYLGVDLMSVAKWEWGKCKPRKGTDTLLRLIEAHPGVLKLLGRLQRVAREAATLRNLGGR